MSIIYTPEEYREGYRDLYGGFRLMGMTHTEAAVMTLIEMHPHFYEDGAAEVHYCYAYRMAQEHNTTINEIRRTIERCEHLEFILSQYARFCDGPVTERMTRAYEMLLIRPQDPERYDEAYKRMISCGMTKKEAKLIAMRLISPPDRDDHIKELKISDEEYNKTLRSALKKYMKAKEQWYETSFINRTWIPKRDEIAMIMPPKGTDLLNDSVRDIECKFCGHKTKYAYISIHGHAFIEDFRGEFWSYIDDEPACEKCVKNAKKASGKSDGVMHGK
jgi:hypothetical protein